jgi:hypothetical protein
LVQTAHPVHPIRFFFHGKPEIRQDEEDRGVQKAQQPIKVEGDDENRGGKGPHEGENQHTGEHRPTGQAGQDFKKTLHRLLPGVQVPA